MISRRLSMCAVLTWAVAACGPGAVSPVPPVSGEPLAVPVPAEGLAGSAASGVQAPPPARLTCVSDASLRAGEAFANVDRATIRIQGTTATVVLTRGPQFWSHSGTWDSAVRESTSHTAEVSTAGGLRITEPGSVALSFELSSAGAFFVGTMSSPLGPQPVTCWDPGSPWGGSRKLFSAHFDWSTGRCVNAAGEDALNALPIAFVRETGQGLCADLSDASLNGQDFGNPDLEGWSLLGARLGGARLFFANLTSATLYGAQLSGLRFGYATVSGSIDAHTQVPDGAGCVKTDSPWAGQTLTCTQ